jgi:hypothetical protein
MVSSRSLCLVVKKSPQNHRRREVWLCVSKGKNIHGLY